VRSRRTCRRAIARSPASSDETSAQVLRHTFGTTLVRGRADLVLVAELVDHARLETTRGYTRPTAGDRQKALDLLPIER
jgi:site-specific recombinase XerD